MEYFGNSTNIASTFVTQTQQTTTTVTTETQTWKSQQVSLLKRNSPKEDPSDPTPLLIDKISSLPMGSARRKSAENLKGTLDGTAANVGDGMDVITRESYKEVKRLRKQSYMLQKVMQEPLPTRENLIGSEEGRFVSNLQDWRPYFINASRPISDAMGSHADTDHSIVRDAGGTASLIPVAVMATSDRISTQMIDHTEGVFKAHQMEMLAHLPSKVVGCVRQLATALDSILSIPFDIMSDVYNGLMMLIDEIANLIDGAIAYVTQWLMGIIGGLVDSIFPPDLLESIMEPIREIASEVGDLFGMLGAFPAVTAVANIVSNISGNFFSMLKGAVDIYNLFKSGAFSNKRFGGFAGVDIDCIEDQLNLRQTRGFSRSRSQKTSKLADILGTVANIGLNGIGGLGNIGSMIGGGISRMIGGFVNNLRSIKDLISSLLPSAIGYILKYLLHKLCGIGMVGNGGFSIGNLFDSLRDNSFSRAMQSYTTHYPILAPLFGKEHEAKNSYAQEASVGMFENSKFVIGAQGHKGVTMMGPGGSVFYKPFGLYQGSNARFNKTYNSVSLGSNNNRNAIAQTSLINSNMSYLEQTTILSRTSTSSYSENVFLTPTTPR